MNGAPKIAPMPTSCPVVPATKKLQSGDDRFGQRRSYSGQHRTYDALRKIELAPDPFHAIRKETAADEDECEADDEE